MQQLADSKVSVNIVPNFFTFNLIQSKWSNVQGIPVVSVFDTSFNAYDSVTKRIEDLVAVHDHPADYSHPHVYRQCCYLTNFTGFGAFQTTTLWHKRRANTNRNA